MAQEASSGVADQTLHAEALGRSSEQATADGLNRGVIPGRTASSSQARFAHLQGDRYALGVPVVCNGPANPADTLAD